MPRSERHVNGRLDDGKTLGSGLRLRSRHRGVCRVCRTGRRAILRRSLSGRLGAARPSVPPGNSYGPSHPQPPVYEPIQGAAAAQVRRRRRLSTIVVIGDQHGRLARLRAGGSLLRHPGCRRRAQDPPNAGLVRYDAKNDALGVVAAIKDALATEKPSAIVIMLGLNDRLPLRDKRAAENAAARKSDKKGKAASSQAMPSLRPRKHPETAKPDSRAGAGDDHRAETQRTLRPAITIFTPTSGRSFTPSASTT